MREEMFPFNCFKEVSIAASHIDFVSFFVSKGRVVDGTKEFAFDGEGEGEEEEGEDDGTEEGAERMRR